MLRIEQIKLKPGHSRQELEEKIVRILRIQKEDLQSYEIFRHSVDARKKPEIYEVYTVDVSLFHEEKHAGKLKKTVKRVKKTQYKVPEKGKEPLLNRPVIAGCGPAGLFCALLLAREGYRPLLAERGAPAEERIRDVQKFWDTGIVNPQSNVQFGEGGAGTFSDGKLNTLVKDSCGRNRFVLETLVQFGAPADILYEQKPHIGTDILAKVVCAMRREICALGGTVRFHSQVTGIRLAHEKMNRKLEGIFLNKTEYIKTDHLVLAVGHSARDTFQMLYMQGIPMQAKSFAVGVRIEHPQNMIQISQYGEAQAESFPPASYKLAEKLENGRGVYTFCMCPGGYVVNASSEEGHLAVNGMSYYSRSGKNANSAVVVTVTPRDFPDAHPLAGVAFQRNLEKRAFREGKGRVPVQKFDDFCAGRASTNLGAVTPQIKGAYSLANVRAIFPEILALSLEQGIRAMDKKIVGFARKDAILSGVESRTSSPVKICRNENLESEVEGIFPCGEGAGYAGGIVSAAMDGMKIAEVLIKRFSPF